MKRQEQTTMHNCIQGWTAIGRWAGVHLVDVLDRCGLAPERGSWCSTRSSGTN